MLRKPFKKKLTPSVSKLNLPGHWIIRQDSDPKHIFHLEKENLWKKKKKKLKGVLLRERVKILHEII